METYQLSLTACLWRLENGMVLTESPSFPELCCAGSSGRLAIQKLQRGTKKLARRLPREELVRRQSIGSVQSEQLSLVIEPPIHSPAWLTPVDISLTVVIWPHEDMGWVLWIPVLGIHVLGRTEREIRELAAPHVRASLARNASMWTGSDGISLPRLAALQRTVQLRLITMLVDVPVHSPKAAAQIADQESQPKKSVLKDAATSLTADPIPRSFGNDHTVAHLASILTGRRPRSVLLVGPCGVGKTAALHSLVRRREEFGLGQTAFYSTSGARLVAGMSSFGMWQERCQALCREAEKAGAILHLGSLTELMEVGRCEGNSMGIAAFLRPYLVRGALLAVAESTPEQLALVERMNPQVVQAFEVVRVAEPDSDTSRQILSSFANQFPQAFVPDAEGINRSIALIDERGLTEIERLHRRYATYSALPGRPLRFLTNLLRDRLDSIQLRNHMTSRFANAERPTPNSLFGRATSTPPRKLGTLTDADIITAFAHETGLPLFLLDDRISFDPAVARTVLVRRVVGQDAAVDCVISLLATIKAGLARPGRPLASLLFIGPTGVGKTELARTLAEYLFGDEERLTRLDMSEFSDPISAQRLIGGSFSDEGVLTARIREQPFSVVLLDEFEKADPMVFDLLLQVLGEGRLTDGGGRLADFTNSVIVMTSNLGAESYQRGAAGFVPRQAEIGDHFLEAVRQFVRPELFNRFDAVVPFSSLDSDNLHQIAEMQVTRLRVRDGLLFRDRGWQLDPEVTDWLTLRGFDPRYGARPLKRTIERELLAPLSEQLNAIRPEQSVAVKVGLTEDRLDVRVAPFMDQAGRTIDWMQLDTTIAVAATNITTMRRRTWQMIESDPVRALRNEQYRLQTQLERERRRMLKRTATGKPWKPEPDYEARLSRAAELQNLIEELSKLGSGIDALEDQALLGVLVDHLAQEFDGAELAQLEQDWWRLATDVYLQQFPRQNKLTLAVFSEHPPTLIDFVLAYREVATLMGNERLELWEYSSIQQGAESKRVTYDNPDAVPLWHRRIPNLSAYLNQVPTGVVGLAWSLTGRGLYARLRGEAGIHVFPKGNNHPLCLVLVEPIEASSFLPPNGIARQGTISKRGKKDRLREYNLDELLIIEPSQGQRVSWRGTTFDRKLEECIRLRFEREVETAIIGTVENQ